MVSSLRLRPVRSVLGALALAALLGFGGSPVDAHPSSHSIPWSLHDCDVVLATFFLPGAAIQSEMPEGFVASIVTTTGGPTVTQIGVEMDDCASGAGSEGDVEGMQYATIWAQVQPPSHLRLAGNGGHYVTFGSLVPDDARRTLLQEHGLLDVLDGEIRITREDALGIGAGVVVKATTTYENGDTMTITTVTDAARPGGSGGGKFVSFTATDPYVSRWRTDWAAHDARQSPGLVQFSPGSRAAALFGTEAIAAQVAVQQWDYTDGKIEFPLPLRR